MKKGDNLIPGIKVKISQFLEKRQFKSLTPLEVIFSDIRWHSYFSPVEDRQGKRFFLKIRTIDNQHDRDFFSKEFTFHNLLQKHPHLPVCHYVPVLIESGTDTIDYLIFNNVVGDNMGTRSGYGTIRFSDKDTPILVNIANAILAFPKSLITAHFKKPDLRGSLFFKKWIEGFPLDENSAQILANNWYWFDCLAQYLSHGDFKPNNFIRTDKSLYLVDWDQICLANPFADIASLWAYAVEKPNWRKSMLKSFLEKADLKDLPLDLLRANLLVSVIFELKVLREKSVEIQRIFQPRRLDDLKIIINNKF